MNTIEMEVIELIKSVTKKKEYTEEEILNTEDFQNGFIDSMEFVQLVIDLEEKFSINIDDEDLALSNFSCVNAIVKMLNKYGVSLDAVSYTHLISSKDCRINMIR